LEIVYSDEITVEQYNGLRQSVGWNPVEATLAETGLKNTAYLIVANDKTEPIGMARVITDYGCQVLVADVIVHPDYQRNGIGKAMMERVMAYIDESIKPGQWKMVNLMAAQGKERFYKGFGFIERPNDASGSGLTQTMRKETL
jgi:GNAT superfamily N-acetyltransferase